MSSTKFEILKAKIKRIVEKRRSKIDFLKIIACHKGSVMPDSITVSFKLYKEKYGDQEFEHVKNYFVDEAKASQLVFHELGWDLSLIAHVRFA